MFNQWDTDLDGELTYAEIVNGISHPDDKDISIRDYAKTEKVNFLFDRYDT